MGTYDPVAFSSEDMSVLYFDDGNTLSHPKADTSINAFRAYFQLAPSMGDVNGDGAVYVTDVTFLIDYILSNQDDGLIIRKSDINGDGGINVADVTELVNIILNQGNKLKVVVNGAEGITFGETETTDPEEKPQAYLTCPDNHHPHFD